MAPDARPHPTFFSRDRWVAVVNDPREQQIPPALEAEVDACCDRFEAAWGAGQTPSLEEALQHASPAAVPYLLPELVVLERHYRRDAEGRPLSFSQLVRLHPAIAEQLMSVTHDLARPPESDAPTVGGRRPGLLSDVRPAESADSRGLHVRCPHCSNPMEILADTPYDDVTCRTCGSTFNLVDRDGPSESATTLRRIGRFDLIARLGVGGFGTVWKARDADLDRLVAVKLPRKGQLSAAETEQFFREARAAAQLRHPNIVSVYEVGRAEDVVYIVSDYVRGVSMADWLTDDRPPSSEIARLCEEIALALEHAHQHGVIHRDLKPSNVMIDQSGEPLIMDFGLAKRETNEITMTVEGQILGTPAYMSPEQARGQSHWTDRRTDIYSLGVMLFRMLTGELPYRGNARMQLHNKLTSDAPDPRRLNHAVPRDLATICLKCVERDPNRRYSTAQEAAEEFRRFLRGEPIRARPISRAARAFRWAKRHPARAAALGLAVLLAILGPLAAWQQRQLFLSQRNRFNERTAYMAEQQSTIVKLSSQIEGLAEELADVRGERPGVDVDLQSWQLGLIHDLVNARQEQMAAQLADENADDVSAIHAGLGLGMLLAEIGRHDEALRAFEKTQRRIATASENLGDDATLADVRADCAARIGLAHRALGNDEAAQQALADAVALRQRLATRDQLSAAAGVRHMETTVASTAGENLSDSERLAKMQLLALVEKSWPTTAEEFYQLACQLTKSDMVLAQP